VKISTWNINGLRSAVDNGFEQWLHQSSNDIVCLQEVKMQEDLLTSFWFSPYESYWNPSARFGYSGVTTLAKPDCKVLHVETGIGDKELDAEGRVLITEFDRFILVNTYAPHSHRELLRVEEKRRFCTQFLILIKKLRLRKKPLIVVGDLNVAHKEIDLTNYKTNKNNAGFLEMERQWMTDLLNHGLCDAFRLFHEDTGHYTWWSLLHDARNRNMGWRLDYILVDESLKNNVKACYHSPDQFGSDHCPVTIEIDFV
jgi:exodeoxyribonuclease-3